MKPPLLSRLQDKIRSVVPGRLFRPRYGTATTLKNFPVLWGHLRQSLAIPINDNLIRKFSEVEGSNFMDADWDNLILLDACRYDTFEETVSLSGELSRVQSVGSKTRQFLRNTFEDDEFHDTVYVTANPQHASLVDDSTFHAVIPVWQDHWDDEHGSVLPDPVTDAALAAADQFPNKRLLVHYLQPHQPFIGPKGQDFMRDHNLQGVEFNQRDGVGELDLYPALNHGLLDVSDDELYAHYKENLGAVLSSVKRLIAGLGGKSVITSDHGELLGDTAGPIPISSYGHGKTFHTPALLDVPWFELDYTDRRSVEAEPPQSEIEVDSSVVENRLSQLGYL